MTKYTITYENGFEYEIEAFRMEDNGTDLKFYDEDDNVLTWISDRSVTCCVSDDGIPEEFAIEEQEGGVVLLDEEENVVAAYRNL